MGKYPIFKEWMVEADKLNEKMKDNPYGGIELGIQLLGATFGPAVEPEVLKIKLGDENVAMNMGDGNGGWQSMSYFRSTYTDHKPEFIELLEKANIRVDEKIKLADSVLYAMVKDQIPRAIVNRMEGNKENTSHQELVNLAISEELNLLIAPLMKAIEGAEIEELTLERSIETQFLSKQESWPIVITVLRGNLTSRAISLSIGSGTFVAYNVDSFALPEKKSQDCAIFLLHKRQIADMVTRMTAFIAKAQYI